MVASVAAFSAGMKAISLLLRYPGMVGLLLYVVKFPDDVNV
jgi:hypothetical protein